MAEQIQTVAIVGSGLMGTGIAEACILSGVKTVLVKATAGDPEASRKRIQASLERSVKKEKLTAEARDRALALLETTCDFARLASADLVIESAAESLPAKHDILSRICNEVRPTAIVASNTSSLRLSQLCEVVSHPERFLGMHFFSPANIMKLVELGALDTTAPATLVRVRELVGRIGKVPVEVGDNPGYLVNRLLVPYILHAIETLEHGVGTPEAIDTAMKLGCGHPLGPLALADLIGLDVVFAMSRSLYQELGDTRYRCPSLLRRLVMNGSLGKKAGLGFYRYGEGEPRANTAIFDFSSPEASVRAAPAA